MNSFLGEYIQNYGKTARKNGENWKIDKPLSEAQTMIAFLYMHADRDDLMSAHLMWYTKKFTFEPKCTIQNSYGSAMLQ